MKEILILVFLILGTIFIFIASIGLIKMPDVYLRMSASTIAATFGVSSMLIGVAIYFGSTGMAFHVAGVIVFLILTVPVGAHMIGRASHINKLPMWDKTFRDDMKGTYNPEKNEFMNPGEKNPANADQKKNQRQVDSADKN
ncbi:MAG: monovalent cation/H(+) antiporter subunit G [Bacteroidales bacterium]